MSTTRRKKSHTRAGEKETETDDIYDEKQREKMLDEDEITAAENAFMQGREMTPDKKKHPHIKTQCLLNSLKTNTKKTNQVALKSAKAIA